MSEKLTIWLGYDAEERIAWKVAEQSLREHTLYDLDIRPISYMSLIQAALHSRSVVHRNGELWDVTSQAPMSTSHAIARFFIPFIDKNAWAIFMDSDILCVADIHDLIALRDESKAVQVVQHNYQPKATTKKDDHIQTQYRRKNWSSVMLWNLKHASNKLLTLQMLNHLPGRDLHRFCWLDDTEIGSLPHRWNWLVGHYSDECDPAIVHFTEGLPYCVGHECDPYADVWRGYARQHGLYSWMGVSP